MTKLFALGSIDRPTQNNLMTPNSDETLVTRHSSNIQCRVIIGYVSSSQFHR